MTASPTLSSQVCGSEETPKTSVRAGVEKHWVRMKRVGKQKCVNFHTNMKIKTLTVEEFLWSFFFPQKHLLAHVERFLSIPGLAMTHCSSVVFWVCSRVSSLCDWPRKRPKEGWNDGHCGYYSGHHHHEKACVCMHVGVCETECSVKCFW